MFLLSFLRGEGSPTLQRHLMRMFVLYTLVGIVVGVAAIGFHLLVELIKALGLHLAAGYHPVAPAGETALFSFGDGVFRPWVLLFLPAMGALIGAWLVDRYAPEAAGHGTDAVIDSYHNKGAIVRTPVPFIKGIASALTVGTGGAAGREGPIAQIGAGFGSLLALWLRLTERERRTLMAAGLAAGVGAIFHAPLAASLFAAEVLYREMDLEYEVIVPCVLASIVSYSVFAILFGWNPLFGTPKLDFRDPRELFFYFLLALSLASFGHLYLRIFQATQAFFAKLVIRPWLKPVLGALGAGAIGFFMPEALTTGYSLLQKTFSSAGRETFQFAGKTFLLGSAGLLAFALVRIFTTSLTCASGGSGGVFGPSIVIGGCIGGAVGLTAHAWFPGIVKHPESFVLVGMAGFFAGVARSPISTIVMVSEMTGNYGLLPPTMWVCILTFLLMGRKTLYESQVPTRLDSPAHMGETFHEIFKRLTVSDALRLRSRIEIPTIPAGMKLSAILQRFSESDLDAFPVIDSSRSLVGIIRLPILRRTLQQDGLQDLVVALDIATEAVTITSQDTLYHALERMAIRHLHEIVVVDPLDPSHIVGILSRSDILSSYDQRLLSHNETPSS